MGRTNTQTICLDFRSQRLCFAVTRIFARCVRARTARESSRRRFDPLSSSLSCRKGRHMALGMGFSRGPPFAVLRSVYQTAWGRMKRYNFLSSAHTGHRRGNAHGHCFFPHHHPVSAADRGAAPDRQASDRRAGAHRAGADHAAVGPGVGAHAGLRLTADQRRGAHSDPAGPDHAFKLYQLPQRAVPVPDLRGTGHRRPLREAPAAGHAPQPHDGGRASGGAAGPGGHT